MYRTPQDLRQWLRPAIAILASALVLLSVFRPWVTGSSGNASFGLPGTDFPLAAVCLALASVATASLAAAAALLGRPDLARLAAVAATIAFVIAAVLVAVVETLSSAVPDSALPTTVRRIGADLGAGVGLWGAAAGSAVAAVAASDARLDAFAKRSLWRREDRTWAAALVALVALTFLFGWIRYQDWIDASAADQALSVQGWAAPWVGPLSLFALWLLIASCVLALAARTTSAGLVAATGGWLVTLVAAVTAIATRSIGDLSGSIAASGGLDLDFQPTPQVWIAFLAGWAAAGVGGWLVSLPPAGERLSGVDLA